MARISLPLSASWITLLVLAMGGAEELRKAFSPGRSADWVDMAANTAGACVADLLYGVVRGLWVARQGLMQSAQPQFDASQTTTVHSLDWRFEIQLSHWRWYCVLLVGSSRRGLSRRQQVVTGWLLSAVLVGVVLLAASLGAADLMLLAVSLGL